MGASWEKHWTEDIPRSRASLGFPNSDDGRGAGIVGNIVSDFLPSPNSTTAL